MHRFILLLAVCYDLAALCDAQMSGTVTALFSNKCVTFGPDKVSQFDCNGSIDQDFVFVPINDSAAVDTYYKIQSASEPDYCWMIENESRSNGAKMIKSRCDGSSTSLQWKVAGSDTSGRFILNRRSHKCLQLAGPATANNRHFNQMTCTKRLIQHFSIEAELAPFDRSSLYGEPGTITPVRTWTSGAFCLHVVGALWGNGPLVRLNPCSNGIFQDFVLISREGGSYYSLMNDHSDKCLAPSFNSRRGDNGHVRQWYCNPTAHGHHWKLNVLPNGDWQLENRRYAGQCLTTDLAPELVIRPCEDSPIGFGWNINGQIPM